MKAILRLTALILFSMLAACSTTQEVTLAKSKLLKPISSVAQAPDSGNSAQMDANLEGALTKEGITIKSKLQHGARTSKDADAVISYVDVWRWDLAMYMKNLTVRLHDAETGDLIAIGQWSDSALHGFRDAKAVMESVVSEMLSKVRSSTTSDK